MPDETSPLPPKQIPGKGGTLRTVHARPVTWRCEWCSQETTDWRYPGPLPRYHDACRQDAQNSLAAGAARRKRQAEREAHPWGRRRPGRPPGA